MGILEKWKRLWERLTGYVQSHIWASLTSSMFLFFLLLVLILQGYLKNQYFEYLVAETGKTERAVLAVTSENLNGILTGCLTVSSEAAINKQLYSKAESVHLKARNRLDLEEELTAISYYTNNIAAVAIVTQEGLLTEYGRYWTGSGHGNLWIHENQETLKQIYGAVMARLDDDMVGRYCISTAPAFHPALPKMQLVHIALPLVGGNKSFDQVDAVLVFTFRLDSIAQSSGLVDGSTQDYTYGYLTDQDGMIIYHEDLQYTGTLEMDYLSGASVMELHQPLDCFGWTAHIVIDTEDMRGNVDQLYRRGLVVCSLLLALCALLWQSLVRRILSPIASIREAMEEIRAGKPNRKIELHGSHELWQLAAEYNSMADALHQQQAAAERSFQEKMRSIELRNRAEREALESQINAHFLCNTLNAINYHVMESGNDEVSGLLKRLSNILHYTFSRKSEYVTLGQEVEWVGQYLYLQKYRLMDRFEYEIDFPQEYGEWPCCKLFLQPFVENSILHGFEDIERGGLIRIVGRPEQDRFRLEVSDNGCGMDQETSRLLCEFFLKKGQDLHLKNSGSGIGIQNVITRMRMYFGDRFAVHLDTEAGRGACFTFWLPLPPGNEEEDTL